MAVEGDVQEGGCPAPRAPVQCYSLASVPLPSVLIGERTPSSGVLPVKGRRAFCCHGCCAVLRFCVFGRNKTESYWRSLVAIAWAACANGGASRSVSTRPVLKHGPRSLTRTQVARSCLGL